ncbi:MAG: DUF6128 domain-containing protein [Suilimivivens sp.]
MYESAERISSAGFASLFGEKRELQIKIQVKNIYGVQDDDYPIYLLTEKQEIEIGSIQIKAGGGNYERSFYYGEEKLSVGNFKILPEDICAVRIRLAGERMITGEWKHIAAPPQKPLIQENTSEENEEERKIRKETTLLAQEEPKLKAVSIPSDKWEQLKSQYKVIHPFGDEREFISIEPKDFIILREAYQKLVNNSFLLHGFYNYRHLILGKDYKLGTDTETCFYLGVPGVFFEREKMVAVMFGFEGFETAGPVEIGKFGYYLRKVEI